MNNVKLFKVYIGRDERKVLLFNVENDKTKFLDAAAQFEKRIRKIEKLEGGHLELEFGSVPFRCKAGQVYYFVDFENGNVFLLNCIFNNILIVLQK
jgi:hypothetical protein